MERNNTLISDLTESSKDVEVWAKLLRVWEMKSAPNEIEHHLIVSDPKKTHCLYLFLSNKFYKGVSTTPIQSSDDDPYEEMFGVPLTQINFKLKDESGCELECEALGEVAKELDMKSWWLSKYEKTF
ncbi:hypothetical protein Bca52824_017263 [Brassica carinata]|uniref:Uncharacterized protein n=1 Tax=Brassica carinata TaxID=52824 RepID=A0A8X7VMR7_BRACI|nr:hypothetical protein Bca52824_017263 [Brassica carinata]